MSPYAQLYAFCQNLDLHVGRNEVVGKVNELTGRRIVHIRSGLDINSVRGYYVRASNFSHPLVKMYPNCDLIVTARDNNRCWERFVFFKELMHLFDEPLETTSSSQGFEDLLKEFFSPKPQRSQEMHSEIKALWQAIGIFCPEPLRAQYSLEREQGKITDLAIAQQLKMPEQIVPSLFHPDYKDIITSLCR